MTDQPANCAACSTALLGRYCYKCGQDSRAKPRPLRELAMEAFSETNLVDTRTVRTMAALAQWASGRGNGAAGDTLG